MLDSATITAAYLGDPEAAPRRARCGTSAASFDAMLAKFTASCASPALALWMAWEERSADEAALRLRELH